MTEIELLKEADTLIEEFKSLELVKEYQRVKVAIDSDLHLKEIEEQRKRLQSSIKYLKDAKKDECIKAAKELQIEYDNNPLVINYRTLKAEIMNLLSVLSSGV